MTLITTDPASAAHPTSGDGEEIVARAGRYYRNTRYLFVAGMIVMGAYFAYDGWVGYPREQALHQQNPKAGVPHSDTDILLQKVLGCTLPPLGLLFLGWTLHNSRGAYRMTADVLSVPGHPDVPMEAVRAIDKSNWDRKGIAYVDYEVGGQVGRLKLDDFVYDRGPTDRIMDRVQAHVAPAAEGFEVGATAGPDESDPA
jgi:hypothetical protein